MKWTEDESVSDEASSRPAQESKHRDLLELICKYCSSEQDQERLQRIKEKTQIEINMRFIKSASNRNYAFPLDKLERSDDSIGEFPGKMPFETDFYDLNDQNIEHKKLHINARVINNYRHPPIASQVKSGRPHRLESERSVKAPAIDRTIPAKLQLPELLNTRKYLSHETQVLSSRSKNSPENSGRVRHHKGSPSSKWVCRTESKEQLKSISMKQLLRPLQVTNEFTIKQILGKKLVTESSFPTRRKRMHASRK